MRNSMLRLAGTLVLTGLAAACGGSGDAAKPAAGGGSSGSGHESTAPADPQSPEEAMRQAEDAVKKAKASGAMSDVKAVDPKAMADLLPETWDGRRKTNVRKSRQNMMGIDVAEVECNYDSEDGNGASYSLHITDMGSMSGPSLGMAYGWSAGITSESETDDEIEKTYKWNGLPAHEVIRKGDGKGGELNVLVGKRFVVVASGNDTPIEKIRGLAEAIGLSKLESLAK